MPDDAPTPPAELPAELVETLEACSPDHLRQVASYAEALAEAREREVRLAEADERDAERRPDDRPNDVPSKATITIKEINDNRYYYWQWREGEQIKSKYKGPVSADE